MKYKKTVIRISIAVVVLGFMIWTVWGNTALQCNAVIVSDEGVPQALSGLRIAQVSDLHNASFGCENEKLLKLLADAEPDMIALTGDLVDSRRTEVDCSAFLCGGGGKNRAVFLRYRKP